MMTLDLGWWKGKDVFVTGITGFKGSWLCMLLECLGAKVHGFALTAQEPSMFRTCNIASLCATMEFGDIRDAEQLKRALAKSKAQLCFHLAAQSLVLESLSNPVETFSTNVVGTAQFLDVVRQMQDQIQSVVIVTSDKCYHNEEWTWGYREVDRLGGKDPYSASKGCAELVTDSFRLTFFNGQKVSSARAGNVIGGGDWSADRIVPDCVRAFQKGEQVTIRSPSSVRPWQHVLEPLAGYLMLAQKVAQYPKDFCGPWNFGPNRDSHKSVGTLASELGSHWGISDPMKVESHHLASKEARMLYLDSSRARDVLGWKPRLGFAETLSMVAAWYRAAERDQKAVTRKQIEEYFSLLD